MVPARLCIFLKKVLKMKFFLKKRSLPFIILKKVVALVYIQFFQKSKKWIYGVGTPFGRAPGMRGRWKGSGRTPQCTRRPVGEWTAKCLGTFLGESLFSPPKKGPTADSLPNLRHGPFLHLGVLDVFQGNTPFPYLIKIPSLSGGGRLNVNIFWKV